MGGRKGKVLNNKGNILTETKKLLYSAGFRMVAYDGDNALEECVFCRKRAWLRQDVQHSKDCKLGLALEEIARTEEELWRLRSNSSSESTEDM